ncbi:MAG: hypothetical protein HYX85_02370 [Chloroflexi bacterium]|nr:hypothetical protein [Chloroflexota bacterium]
MATLVSNVLNPFLVGLAIILLLSFASAASPGDALRWALVAVGLSILPVFVIVVYLLRTGRLDNFFANVREQRTKIYVVNSLCAIAGVIILAYLGAPAILVATFAAGLSATVIFMCINFWWKISLHTAFIAASATVLVILYGWMGVPTITLVPLTAWARIELKSHSFAQAVAGALIAAVVVVAVFYPMVLS